MNIDHRNLILYGGGPVRGDVIPRLIALAENTNRGLNTEKNGEIITIMDNLAFQNEMFVRSDPGLNKKINGTWELVWTTEKETLFFAKSGLFSRRVSDILQTIDTQNNKLNNLILFEGTYNKAIKFFLC